MSNGRAPIAGLELRDRVAAGYRRRMGLEWSAAEALAKSDLEIVDATKRGNDPTRLPKRKKPERKAMSVEAEARKVGAKVRPLAEEAPANRARPDVLYAQAHKLGERYSNMTARILRICETGGVSTATDLADVAKDAAIPVLAQEYLNVWANFIRRMGGDGATTRIGFANMNAKDARRKFVRLCEDICDRSARWLGPWWVPK